MARKNCALIDILSGLLLSGYNSKPTSSSDRRQPTQIRNPLLREPD